MYQVNHVVMLDGETFYNVSVWNMFCKKRMLTVVVLLAYTIGLGSVATAMPALKVGNINGFILNAGIGAVLAVMVCYLCYNNVSRLKRQSRNEEFLAKTEKHIKMDEDQIINYRTSVSEQIIYKWDQVEGIYERKNEFVIAMKDKQLLVLVKSKLEPKEIEFIRAKAEVRMLWKKAMDAKIWLVIAAGITVACVALGAVLYFQ